MSLVIESSSHNNWQDSTGTTVVIPKPTGLAVGNVLLAFIYSSKDTGAAVAAPSTPAGWTLISSYDGGTTVIKLRVFAKVADSSDVAASNFSFTVDQTDTASVGSLFRLSGASGATPFSDTATSTDVTNDATLSFSSLDLNTLIDNSYLFMVIMCRNATGDPTVSGYTVSGTNPTWTEQTDKSLNADLSHGFAIATAPITTARTITTAQATASLSVSNAFLFLASASPVTNATINAGVLSMSASMQSASGSASFTAGTLTLSATLQTATATAETKKYTNVDKNADVSLINEDKS